MPNTRHPVDVYVGARIRMRRQFLGIGQVQLAKVLGISFQQVQKYESGSNRISSSKLYETSRALGIGIGYFFDGYDETEDSQNVAHRTFPAQAARRLIVRADGIEVALALSRLKNASIRRRLLNLIAEIGGNKDVT